MKVQHNPISSPRHSFSALVVGAVIPRKSVSCKSAGFMVFAESGVGGDGGEIVDGWIVLFRFYLDYG